VNTHNFHSILTILILAGAACSLAVKAQEPSSTPDTTKVEFENEQIRVMRSVVGPHQKTSLHSHPSRLGITITRNEVRTYLPAGLSTTATRSAHEYFWSEPITHTVENLSNTSLQNVEIELKQAKAPGVEVKPQAGNQNAAGTAADPVAVEQEPHHHVVFENQYVRVLDVIVKPGETTLFHRHSLDNVAVQLSDGTIKRQSPGEDWVTSTPSTEGSASFIAGTRKPYVHRIANIGTSDFHVMDVEILP
jgi:quercetin dioxygenase-like cupin family protein